MNEMNLGALGTYFLQIPAADLRMVTRVILQTLDSLLAGDHIPDRQFGLCFNVDTGVVNRLPREYEYRRWAGQCARNLVCHMAQSWPKYSGDWSYPVPGANGESAAVAFYGETDCWAGEYGRLRRELTQHVRDRLAELIGISYWEITAYGFDGGTDETDERVIWVTAESEAQVQDAVAGTDADYTPLTLLPPADAVDFHLPEGADALRGRLLQFQLET